MTEDRILLANGQQTLSEEDLPHEENSRLMFRAIVYLLDF